MARNNTVQLVEERCATHDVPLVRRPNPVGRGTLLYCPTDGCNEQARIETKRKVGAQIKMQFGSGERAQVVDHEKEASVQRRIIDLFRAHGFTVLETSEHRRKIVCEQKDSEGNVVGGCGRAFFPPGGRGTSKGIPDLLISHSRWKLPVWIGVEVKGSHTRFSCPEQAELAALGMTIIARSHESAWDEVQDVLKTLQLLT